MLKKRTYPELSIILPCLNEEQSIGLCLEKIKSLLDQKGILAEVIVVDNNSTDSTSDIVLGYMKSFPELILIQEKEVGYGSAYLKGFSVAQYEYIFIADADGTYDFNQIPLFINELKNGADLVIGNRFSNTMERDAMPWTHRYVGNPFLSFITRLFFNIKIRDIHCGARAIKKSAYKKLRLQTAGMEFASEMIIKAAKRNLKISEVSISYKKRIGISKLNSFGDGWRHLRFILLYSPLVLFLIPGLTLFLVGSFLTFLFFFTNPILFGITFYFHPIFFSALMMIVGYQLVFFTGFARIYAVTHLGDEDKSFEKLFRYITIEKAGFIGILLAIVGILIYSSIFINWIHSGFGSLEEIKDSVIALVLTVIGIQTVSGAFMLSMLGIKER